MLRDRFYHIICCELVAEIKELVELKLLMENTCYFSQFKVVCLELICPESSVVRLLPYAGLLGYIFISENCLLHVLEEK